jgi:putative oxidoreductase
MRLKRVGLLLLEALLGIFFALQGIVKLSGSPAWVARFRGWGYPDHFYVVVGVAEVAGAGLLVLPKTRVYGAALLIAIMAGAAVTHLLHGEPQIVTALVLLTLLALVAVARVRSGGARRGAG